MNLLLFRKILLLWYDSNKRDLPWRENPTPYNIWISEIIMQQTRIYQGINYYNRFIEKFPNTISLAAASENDVLKMWQGLGYYSRARNLLFAAQQIINDYDGVFPTHSKEIKKLKGVGDYTAAAIASIVFNEPVAAIDGNVYRVLSRIYAVDLQINSAKGKNYFKNLANELIDRERPGDFNQALMEFGALQCIPKNPDCPVCPLQNYCSAFKNETIKYFPVKIGKTQIHHRYFNYFVLEHEQSILFNKRTEQDIWKNMYDFPLIETDKPLNISQLTRNENWSGLFNNNKVTIIDVSDEITSLLSHQHIHTRFYQISINSVEYLISKFMLIDKHDIYNLPVPKIIEKYLLKLNLII